ncbi:hypothetical protein GS416_09960 [Rhodococcus hoagii]|nr:hypothetical protein [Prescottella equi]
MVDRRDLAATADETQLAAASTRLPPHWRPCAPTRGYGPCSSISTIPAVSKTSVDQRHDNSVAVPDARILAWMRGQQFAEERQALHAEIRRLHEYCAPLLATFSPMFVEAGDTTGFVAEAENAGKGVFARRRRPNSSSGASNRSRLRARISHRIACCRCCERSRHPRARRTHTCAAQAPHRPVRTRGVEPVGVEQRGGAPAGVRVPRRTVACVDGDPATWQLLESQGFPTADEISVYDEVLAAWTSWRDCVGADDESLTRWRNGAHWVTAWERDSAAWVDETQNGASRRFLTWSRFPGSWLRCARRDSPSSSTSCSPSHRGHRRTGRLHPRRGTRVDRRAATGHRLADFDTALRDGEVDDFIAAAGALRAEQVRALPAALLSRRPFQAGALRGDVGELRRLLDRKRGGATFRQLMARYGEHILAATPCVFVSPGSLAQFIPPGSVTFDLVVFDEASQVTVAQAIGALGRGGRR